MTELNKTAEISKDVATAMSTEYHLSNDEKAIRQILTDPNLSQVLKATVTRAIYYAALRSYALGVASVEDEDFAKMVIPVMDDFVPGFAGRVHQAEMNAILQS